ncbi:MAG TPA: PAS domain S-box protein [Acidobacteriaceae bacterium]|jgi:PAS domain S-box-containing protein|nr:PAS domain S-box protein [Acidobacteriaceae bacterium]
MIELSSLNSDLELSRLQALSNYDLAEAPHDPALDDIARLAAQVCNAPLGAVTILEREQVLLIGRYGIDLTSAPRQSLPCETTVNGEGLYQIPDARRDPEFSPGGIPLGDRRYRFYAGAPVLAPDSVAIGCLIVLDASARKLTSAQLQSLESLSHLVTTRLELARRSREIGHSSRARQRVESALVVERNFVSAVLDTVGALVVVYDTAGRIVRFNRACEIISGYQSSDLIGKFPWERLIPKEEVQGYVENFQRIRSGQFPTSYENYWLSSDGVRRRISWSATAMLDSNNQVAFVITTGIDVTVQRVAETTIRESEAKYRQIVEGSLGLVCTHNMEGLILSINEHGAAALGYSVKEVVGHKLQEFTQPERQNLLDHYFEELRNTGEAQGLLHLRHAKGDERAFAYRNRVVAPLGAERYVLGFGVDITDQIHAEEQLRSLMRQSNSVLESVGDGIYGIDLEGRVTIVNPAAAQMLGYKPEELIGRNIHELIHHTRPDGTPYPKEDCPIQGSLRHLSTVRVANELFWRKDGTSFPVEYVARPQIEATANAEIVEPGKRRQLVWPGQNSEGDQTAADAQESSISASSATAASEAEQGRAVGVVVAFTDISERNALDRMKDEFISTVSHELRTPLTSLRAALGLVSGGALNARPEKMRQMMEIAIGNTDRLVRLVNDILDLERIGSGKAELHFTQTSADDLFHRATTLQQASATRANIRFTLEPNNVMVWVDPDRILQTLSNLISNAIKFSPQATTIPSEIRLTASYVTSDEALIEVQDQGRGIPTDKLQQIFDRFKQVDASDSRAMGGTGLGLAICRSIVQQHGGHIWASSTLGEGSTFHFTLPTRPSIHLG